MTFVKKSNFVFSSLVSIALWWAALNNCAWFAHCCKWNSIRTIILFSLMSQLRWTTKLELSRSDSRTIGHSCLFYNAIIGELTQYHFRWCKDWKINGPSFVQLAERGRIVSHDSLHQNDQPDDYRQPEVNASLPIRGYFGETVQVTTRIVGNSEGPRETRKP